MHVVSQKCRLDEMRLGKSSSLRAGGFDHGYKQTAEMEMIPCLDRQRDEKTGIYRAPRIQISAALELVDDLWKPTALFYLLLLLRISDSYSPWGPIQNQT